MNSIDNMGQAVILDGNVRRAPSGKEVTVFIGGKLLDSTALELSITEGGNPVFNPAMNAISVDSLSDSPTITTINMLFHRDGLNAQRVDRMLVETALENVIFITRSFRIVPTTETNTNVNRPDFNLRFEEVLNYVTNRHGIQLLGFHQKLCEAMYKAHGRDIYSLLMTITSSIPHLGGSHIGNVQRIMNNGSPNIQDFLNAVPLEEGLTDVVAKTVLAQYYGMLDNYYITFIRTLSQYVDAFILVGDDLMIKNLFMMNLYKWTSMIVTYGLPSYIDIAKEGGLLSKTTNTNIGRMLAKHRVDYEEYMKLSLSGSRQTVIKNDMQGTPIVTVKTLYSIGNIKATNLNMQRVTISQDGSDLASSVTIKGTFTKFINSSDYDTDRKLATISEQLLAWGKKNRSTIVLGVESNFAETKNVTELNYDVPGDDPPNKENSNEATKEWQNIISKNPITSTWDDATWNIFLGIDNNREKLKEQQSFGYLDLAKVSASEVATPPTPTEIILGASYEVIPINDVYESMILEVVNIGNTNMLGSPLVAYKSDGSLMGALRSMREYINEVFTKSNTVPSLQAMVMASINLVLEKDTGLKSMFAVVPVDAECVIAYQPYTYESEGEVITNYVFNEELFTKWIVLSYFHGYFGLDNITNTNDIVMLWDKFTMSQSSIISIDDFIKDILAIFPIDDEALLKTMTDLMNSFVVEDSTPAWFSSDQIVQMDSLEYVDGILFSISPTANGTTIKYGESSETIINDIKINGDDIEINRPDDAGVFEPLGYVIGFTDHIPIVEDIYRTKDGADAILKTLAIPRQITDNLLLLDGRIKPIKDRSHTTDMIAMIPNTIENEAKLTVLDVTEVRNTTWSYGVIVDKLFIQKPYKTDTLKALVVLKPESTYTPASIASAFAKTVKAHSDQGGDYDVIIDAIDKALASIHKEGTILVINGENIIPYLIESNTGEA